MQKFYMSEKNEHINDWIEKGDHDLGTAKLIYLHIPQYFDVIAFHTQQAVEKYLKAILISKNITFPKTHNLIYLFDLLSDFIKIEEQKYNQAIILNNFGVEVRYPNQTIHLSDIEL